MHRNFILAMHNGAMQAAPLLAETLDLSGRHQLFDTGGRPGTYSIFLVKLSFDFIKKNLMVVVIVAMVAAALVLTRC